MRFYIVRCEGTVVEEYRVEAKDEQDALQNFSRGGLIKRDEYINPTLAQVDEERFVPD